MCHSGSCQNDLGTRAGKRTTDGMRRPGCHQPAGHHHVHGVCIIQSHSHHKFLPQHSATHRESCVQFVFRVLMARLNNFLSHNSCLHKTGMYSKRHGSCLSIQPARRIKGRLVFYPSGNRLGFLVCVMSNQHTSSEGQCCHYRFTAAGATQSDNVVLPVCCTVMKWGQHNHTMTTTLRGLCLLRVLSEVLIYSPAHTLFLTACKCRPGHFKEWSKLWFICLLKKWLSSQSDTVWCPLVQKRVTSFLPYSTVICMCRASWEHNWNSQLSFTCTRK